MNLARLSQPFAKPVQVLCVGPYLSAHRNHSLCVLGLSAELGVLHSLSVHLKLSQSLMVTKQLC